MGCRALIERYNPANWSIDWGAVMASGLAVFVAIALAYIAYLIVFAIVGRLIKLSDSHVDDIIVARVRKLLETDPAAWHDPFASEALPGSRSSPSLGPAPSPPHP